MQWDSRWYAAFVETGEEQHTRQRIDYRTAGRGIRTLVPERTVKEYHRGRFVRVSKPVYPGYVLLNGEMEVEDYYQLKNVPGIISIIKDKNGPLPVNHEEIHLVLRLLGNSEVIDVSRGFIEGNRITILEGPLVGLEGMIRSVDKRKGRVKIATSFLGQERIVELSVDIIEKAV